MTLVERLRDWPAAEQGDALSAGFVGDLMHEAAAELEAKDAENLKLREALAEAADELKDLLPFLEAHHMKINRLSVIVEQARAALSPDREGR